MESVDFTKRQQLILALLAEGLSNAEISNIVRIKEPTVKMHIKQLFNKTGTKSRLSLVVWYYRTLMKLREQIGK